MIECPAQKGHRGKSLDIDTLLTGVGNDYKTFEFFVASDAVIDLIPIFVILKFRKSIFKQLQKIHIRIFVQDSRQFSNDFFWIGIFKIKF